MGGKRPLAMWAALALFIAACSAGSTPSDGDDLGLTTEQIDSLSSLEQVDDYPLYVMHHYAPEPLVTQAGSPALAAPAEGLSWGCSLFAALTDPDSSIFGRNFDWEFSPALLLFNHPDNGYDSVSMVDIEYLGYPGEASGELAEKPLSDIVGLLDAPRIPFDGMNEAGLTIAMAAVPATQVPSDPSKDTVDSLGVIRVALNSAATVDEAVDVFESLNIDFEGQTPLHYLLADRTGDAAVIEFDSGEIRVLRSDTDWLHMTNYLLSSSDSTVGQCDRYDAITEELEATAGELDLDTALRLLARVAQSHTQWSITYDMSSGDVRVAMGQAYSRIHSFTLELEN
jgi:choloylglycine hydrolase